ncbi:MAG: hypothetical protein QNK37_31945 [Acidobacteriota bacterium]|nr:hypothetical protein [Acidobacteriota bacterium]
MRYIKVVALCLVVLVSPVFTAGDKAVSQETVLVTPTIKGSLYWPNGDPVEQVLIEVTYMRFDCTNGGSVWSDEDGKFQIRGLKAGSTYLLKIRVITLDGDSYYTCWTSVQVPDGTVTRDLYLEEGSSDGCPAYACP